MPTGLVRNFGDFFAFYQMAVMLSQAGALEQFQNFFLGKSIASMGLCFIGAHTKLSELVFNMKLLSLIWHI